MTGGEEERTIQSQRAPLLLNKLRPVDKIFFIQNISVLLRAGFSLSHALTVVEEQIQQKRFKKIVTELKKNVESGDTFANALRRYEEDFGSLFINMVESGEMSGKLEDTLESLFIQLKKSHALFLKVRNALAYPIVITIAMFVIGTIMVIFVLPKITDLYKGSTTKLPLATRIVIGFSEFVQDNGILVGFTLLSIVGILILIYKQKNGRYFFHMLALRLPIAGSIIQEINLARFSRIFHSLISTDIPIVQSFHIMANVVGNEAYKRFLQNASRDLEAGVAIGTVLEGNAKLFPPTVTEMISVGEESGALDDMTKEMAEFYEEEASSTLDGLSTLIEPILMLFLGVGVALIAVAVLYPMYQLVNVI